MSSPDLLTIAEVAAILRIGRTTAYELAARDLATGGGEGLGVLRVGNLLRVRRAALEALVGGPVSWPTPAQQPQSSNVAPCASMTAAADRFLVEP
jgi:excisionase family DNA binding protein